MMITDRSLSEIAPGVYSSPVKLKRAGRFDVPLLIDQPRVAHCFSLEVGESPDGERDRPEVAITVTGLFGGRSFKPGDPAALRFKIADAITGQSLSGLKDVQIMVFEPPGIWHQRQWAKEVDPGVYEVTPVFPRAGLYYALARVPSRGTRFADLPAMRVPVIDGGQRREINNGSNRGGAKNE